MPRRSTPAKHRKQIRACVRKFRKRRKHKSDRNMDALKLFMDLGCGGDYSQFVEAPTPGERDARVARFMKWFL